MITQIHDLIEVCSSELEIREYRNEYGANLYSHWIDVEKWMSENNILEFSREIGNRYCDIKIGTHLIKKELTASERLVLPALKKVTNSGYFWLHELVTFILHLKEKGRYAVIRS